MGNPRYRNQEMNETGFRSYFREHATGFTLLEPLQTFESAAIAEEMTETLLRENADLAAIYVAGGGISGALNAIGNSKRAGDLVVIGYELMDVTRSALLDGRGSTHEGHYSEGGPHRRNDDAGHLPPAAATGAPADRRHVPRHQRRDGRGQFHQHPAL